MPVGLAAVGGLLPSAGSSASASGAAAAGGSSSPGWEPSCNVFRMRSFVRERKSMPWRTPSMFTAGRLINSKYQSPR